MGNKKLKQLKEEYAAINKKMRDMGKDAFLEAMADVFEEHPKLQAIRWEQFTPYFNDGDACEFNVYERYIKFDGIPDTAGDYEDGFEMYSSWDKDAVYPSGFKRAYKAVGEIMSEIPKEILEFSFGDHARVTVTRDGAEVEECFHG